MSYILLTVLDIMLGLVNRLYDGSDIEYLSMGKSIRTSLPLSRHLSVLSANIHTDDHPFTHKDFKILSIFETTFTS